MDYLIDDLLLEIFNYLHFVEISRLKQLNHRFFQLIHNKYEQTDIELAKLTTKEIRILSPKSKTIEYMFDIINQRQNIINLPDIQQTFADYNNIYKQSIIMNNNNFIYKITMDEIIRDSDCKCRDEVIGYRNYVLVNLQIKIKGNQLSILKLIASLQDNK